MADNDVVKTPEEILDLPKEVRAFMEQNARGDATVATIDNLLPGNQWDGVRGALLTSGIASYRDDDGQDRVLAADFDADGKLIALAAAIPRQSGKALDFINSIEDFKDAITSTPQGRKDAIATFHKIYRADGMTNTAIQKMSALVAPQGSFKITSVKGQRGKSGDKQALELQTAANWWKDNVNARGEDTVITGDRGITAFIVRGARLAMIEGDHIARHLWPKGQTQVPNLKPFSLPMNLQTYSAQHIEIPAGLEGTDFEIMYWKPPTAFVALLKDPKDKNLAKLLQKIIPSDVKSALIKDGQYYLDPSLLIHIKNRGTGIEAFGESIIEPTLPDIRYKRALDALELTVITNVMARCVILKVGSDNEKSVYHKAEVSGARLGLLQRMMRNVGPAATILWAGPDLEAIEISAHNALPDLVERMRFAERRHMMSLGVPAVLFIGEGGDGKAVAAAAALAIVAQLQELQAQYTQVMNALLERIALENGYEQVEGTWEWHDNLLSNKEAAAEMILKIFQLGIIDTETAAEELGFSYDALEARMGNDVTKGYREKAFGPPLGAQTTNATGQQNGDTGGRPNDNQSPSNQDPRSNKETGTTPINPTPVTKPGAKK